MIVWIIVLSYIVTSFRVSSGPVKTKVLIASVVRFKVLTALPSTTTGGTKTVVPCCCQLCAMLTPRVDAYTLCDHGTWGPEDTDKHRDPSLKVYGRQRFPPNGYGAVLPITFCTAFSPYCGNCKYTYTIIYVRAYNIQFLLTREIRRDKRPRRICGEGTRAPKRLFCRRERMCLYTRTRARHAGACTLFTLVSVHGCCSVTFARN